MRVLEVGCGAGELARALDAAGYDVVAVDPEAPEDTIFRRTTLEALDDPGPFDAAVSAYALHHLHELDGSVERLAELLSPGGVLVLEEFGWDRVDGKTAKWYAAVQERAFEEVRAEWSAEHEGLHGWAAMSRALDARFEERLLEWRPYLYRCLERDFLEVVEQRAIDQHAIQAVGLRYVGARR